MRHILNALTKYVFSKKKKKQVADLSFPSVYRFMADNDAWRELAEIYVSLQMYVSTDLRKFSGFNCLYFVLN